MESVSSCASSITSNATIQDFINLRQRFHADISALAHVGDHVGGQTGGQPQTAAIFFPGILFLSNFNPSALL